MTSAITHLFSKYIRYCVFTSVLVETKSYIYYKWRQSRCNKLLHVHRPLNKTTWYKQIRWNIIIVVLPSSSLCFSKTNTSWRRYFSSVHTVERKSLQNYTWFCFLYDQPLILIKYPLKPILYKTIKSLRLNFWFIYTSI